MHNALKHRCIHPRPLRPIRPAVEQLNTNGKDTISTGRYDIKMTEGSVEIYDKKTDTWAKAWGDPHFHTSDGDKGQFHDKPLTVVLQDGTKVTINPKKVNNNLAVVGSVTVNKGNEAVTVGGFNDGKAGLDVDKKYGWQARLADARQADGTVLRAGHEVDDLFFQNGKEFRGTDPSQRFGEIDLDKLGAKYNRPRYINVGGRRIPIRTRPCPFHKLPKNIQDLFKQWQDKIGKLRPQPLPFPRPFPGIRPLPFPMPRPLPGPRPIPGHQPSPAPAPGNGPVGGGSNVSGGGSIYDKLFALLAKLEDKLKEKVNSLDGLDPKENKAQFDKTMFEIQQLQSQMQQMVTMATNLQKTEHDTKMAVIRNLA